MTATSDTSPRVSVDLTEEPPVSIGGVLARLGPGLIVAGSIVGSGELIATTKTGAQAGFWLLWLIVVGCVIKVFAQVEFGRFSLVTGVTTMAGLNRVPGPALQLSAAAGGPSARGNWIVWYWFAMWLASIGQLGGIVGGVGQAMAIAIPLTTAGREYNHFVDARARRVVAEAELRQATAQSGERAAGERVRLEAKIAALRELVANQEQALQERLGRAALARDDFVGDALLLTLGRARFRELGGTLSGDGRDADLAAFRAKAGEAVYVAAGGDPAATRLHDFLATLGAARFQAWGGDPADFRSPASTRAVGRAAYERQGRKPAEPYDARLWAALIAVATAVVLYYGRYNLIQHFSTAMVAGFTFVTVANVLMLQLQPSWAVTWQDIVDGLSFRLPPADPNAAFSPLATALATFGIIGVGATELICYPYWCLEKGYARFTGPRDNTEAWSRRARGWMRVMQWDAWCSMAVYTFATVAFYLCGAAILGRARLDPEGGDMIRTLTTMYEPVFGAWASVLFLFGAFAVLYSTFFVANASHARVFADAMRVLGFVGPSESANLWRVRVLSGVFPLLCLVLYLFFPQPAALVLLSGLMQAMMLPMLALAALYFRYRHGDDRLRPGRWWDAALWISAVGMAVAGLWAAWTHWK